MPLILFNSMSKQKELFLPIKQNHISVYVCGQTVYDYCHLGHARKAIVFDMIRRWFLTSGYTVDFVENITDIDDKIIAKAQAESSDITTITTYYTAAMLADFSQLNILPPTMQPKATAYIGQMLDIISQLIAQGYAYQANNNDIYYSVTRFAQYGKLSGKKIADLQVGSRVACDIYKQNPLDFVLWKASQTAPYWPSQYGNGRPGWHIECSAMAAHTLGITFDIHGGGQDLQFPHHDNEIAQSEACFGHTLANYWLHNGFLNIANNKMSKSLGNMLSIRALLARYSGNTIRFFMLKTHYRSPLYFNDQALLDAHNSFNSLICNIKEYKSQSADDNIVDIWSNSYMQKFALAMNDDFNTPLALSVLFEINKQSHQRALMIYLLESLGFDLTHLHNTASATILTNKIIDSAEVSDAVRHLIQQREQARANQDWQLADQLRASLLEHGFTLADTATS
jgi:cysteinyl-tRNA synthetase